MNSVIFYSWLSLWSMKNKSGAPSFYKTVELYVKKGWNVYLVTNEEKNRYIDLLPPERVFVVPKYKTDEVFVNTKLNKASIFIRQMHYTEYAKKVTQKILESNITCKFVLYAYEIYGVKVAKWASTTYGIPCVSRFQGTILDGIKDTIWNRVRYYPHFQALGEETDLIIMTNDGTRGDSVLKNLKNKTRNIKFWVNGLDLIGSKEKYDYSDFRQEYGLKKEQKVLLTVSRLERWKHVERAIFALDEVVKEYENISLVIVGDGAHRPDLEKLVEQLHLEKNVIFVGSIPHDQVYHFIANCDIFLSLYDLSNVGNPLLEAMCLGAPIITLANGDTGKFVENYKNGILLNTDELSLVPIKILEILHNKQLENSLREHAMEFANRNLYTWEKRMDMEYSEVEKLLLS